MSSENLREEIAHIKLADEEGITVEGVPEYVLCGAISSIRVEQALEFADEILSHLKCQIEQMENPYEVNDNYAYVLPNRSTVIYSTNENREYLSYGFEVGRQKVLSKLQ